MNNNQKLKSITIADNEPFLRQISTPVDIASDEALTSDIKVLEEYCLNNEAMAMAAVQLGIPKRLVYLKNTNLDIINKMQANKESEEDRNYNEAKVLINPTIIKREGLTEYWEACASCLDNCGRVLRPYKIELEYFDISNNKHHESFIGFPATVLSHELDHLDGILHMDVAEEVLQKTAEERKAWRQTHGYQIHSEIGDYETLKQEFKASSLIRKK